MMLTILGASGRTGGEIVRQAAAAGHNVTAVVRSGSGVADLPRGSRLAEVADMRSADQLMSVVAGRDAVLSGLGPRSRRTAGSTGPITKATLEAMTETGVARILVVSAAPLGPPPDGDGFASRRLMWPLVSSILRPVYDDLRATEAHLASSGLEWTAVRPPRLVNRPVAGRIRTALGENLVGGRAISRADLARAMLAMIEDRATFGQTVGIAW